MKKEVLQEIGLTKSESSVYIAMLEIGKSSTGKIVDRSGISSSKIYEILDRLIRKGLASYIIERGVKYFEASEPERIHDLIDKREKEIEEQKNRVEELIPLLKERQLLSKYKSEATIYKGMKGLHSAFYDGLDKMTINDEFLVIGIPDRTERVNRFFAKLGKEADRRNVKSRMIFNESSKGNIQTNEENYKERKIKYMPEISPSAINVMGDRTIIFPKEISQEFILIVIDNKDIADSFRVYFDKLWSQKTKVMKGFEAGEKIFNEMLEYDEALFIGARGYLIDRRPGFVEDWAERAEKKGFKLYNIVDPKVKGHKITTFNFVETKYLLKKEFSELSVIWIYGEKVVFANWTEKEPTIIVIEDKKLNQTYRKQFDTLWNQQNLSFEEQEGVEVAYENFLEKLKPKDEVINFGAMPKDKRAADFGLDVMDRMTEITKVRLIYYGLTKEHLARAKEMKKRGAEVRIYDTDEIVPISTLVSRNLVLNTVLGKNTTLFETENKILAQSYKNNFEIVWEKAKEV